MVVLEERKGGLSDDSAGCGSHWKRGVCVRERMNEEKGLNEFEVEIIDLDLAWWC